jgi:hypothetical protein
MELLELNAMLKSPKIDIPFVRREVSASGANYQWLQKHIGDRNKDLPARLKVLLCLKEKVVINSN